MKPLHATLAALSARIPGPPNAADPANERYAEAFAHGTMSVGFYAPRGVDPQGPHAQDELYIVEAGRADINIDGVRQPLVTGDVVFVGAGADHRFENMSPDFGTWVVFWGPAGGE